MHTFCTSVGIFVHSNGIAVKGSLVMQSGATRYVRLSCSVERILSIIDSSYGKTEEIHFTAHAALQLNGS